MKLLCRLKNIFFLFCMMLFIIKSPVFALSEQELDEQLLGDISGDDVSNSDAVTGSLWQIFGFLESLNHFYIPEQGRDETSEYRIIKLESRGRLDAKYGTPAYFAKTVMDVYFYPYKENENPEEPEWENPRDSGSIEIQELYLKGGNKFQFKIGKQLFSWGTADMFQITNYFDQPDQREYFAVDKDERYEGIPAVSFMLLIGNFSIEAAGTPVHNPALLPEDNNFWHSDPDPVTTPMGELPVVIKQSETLPANGENASFGVRTGGTIKDLDFHFSYFNGINSNIIYRPELTGTSTTDMLIELRPYYDRIQAFGFDSAFIISKLSVRAEAFYSHNMIAVKETDQAALQNGIAEITIAGSTDTEISDVERAPYFSYTAGADYNLWGNNGLILIEWMQGRYLRDRDEYIEPLINEMLLIRIQDKFFNESLEAEIAAILRPDGTDTGYALTGELTYDFKNGLTIGAGGIFFTGKEDELFSLFNDKDMVFLKARMTF